MTFKEAFDALYQIRHITGSQCAINPSELARDIVIICDIYEINKEDFIEGMITEIYKRDKLKKFNWLWD